MKKMTVGSGGSSPNRGVNDPETSSMFLTASEMRSEPMIRTWAPITTPTAHEWRRRSAAAIRHSTANVPSFAAEFATNGNSALGSAIVP